MDDSSLDQWYDGPGNSKPSVGQLRVTNRYTAVCTDDPVKFLEYVIGPLVAVTELLTSCSSAFAINT